MCIKRDLIRGDHHDTGMKSFITDIVGCNDPCRGAACDQGVITHDRSDAPDKLLSVVFAGGENK